MGQKLFTFRGDTLDDAYRRMRAALGENAVVLSTTDVKEPGLRGLLGRTGVEVTASAPESEAVRRSAAPAAGGIKPEMRPRTAIERKYDVNAPVGSDERVSETIHYFKQLVQEAQQRIQHNEARSMQRSAPAASRPANKPAPAAKRRAAPQRPSGPATEASSSAKPAQSTPAPASTTSRVETTAAAISTPSPAPAEPPHPIDELRRSVQEMQQMLNVLMVETTRTGPHAEYAPHYRALVDEGISRRTAASLVARVARESDHEILRDPRVFRERMKFEIRKTVSVTGGIQLSPGTRHTVAFVGPTGVGKTTNLAKLAAEYAVRERVKVGLITADTYRIAAPEQLRVYANIIGLPMRVVNDAREMAEAIEAFSNCNLVLIDTAGGSQFNTGQIQELKNVLDAAQPDEVFLLMSAGTQLHELNTTAENFGVLNPTSLFFTKLDETQRYGALYTLHYEAMLPLSYFSIGQDVPNDIEQASAGKVASLVLEGGENRVRSSSKSA